MDEINTSDSQINQITLINQKTGKPMQTLEISNLDQEIEIFAMEYFDEQTKKWKLTYTCDKNEYESYIEWTKTPELTKEQEKARKKLWKKIMKRKI
jgi:hypothetical protein